MVFTRELLILVITGMCLSFWRVLSAGWAPSSCGLFRLPLCLSLLTSEGGDKGSQRLSVLHLHITAQVIVCVQALLLPTPRSSLPPSLSNPYYFKMWGSPFWIGKLILILNGTSLELFPLKGIKEISQNWKLTLQWRYFHCSLSTQESLDIGIWKALKFYFQQSQKVKSDRNTLV